MTFCKYFSLDTSIEALFGLRKSWMSRSVSSRHHEIFLYDFLICGYVHELFSTCIRGSWWRLNHAFGSFSISGQFEIGCSILFTRETWNVAQSLNFEGLWSIVWTDSKNWIVTNTTRRCFAVGREGGAWSADPSLCTWPWRAVLLCCPATSFRYSLVLAIFLLFFRLYSWSQQCNWQFIVVACHFLRGD